MMKFLAGVIATTALLLAGFFVGQTYFLPAPVKTAPLAGNFNTTGGGTYNLQATITSSQTTINLSSFLEPQSNIAYTMSYLNSSIEYATIAPQTSQSEFVSFTGITQNSDGSATLTGVQRGLDRSYPYTASSTLALPHAGQSRFILSNPPQVYNSYGALTNANTWSAVNTFSSTSPPTYDTDPVWANFSTQIFADVAYVNSVVAAGAANASETVKGIVQLATGAQAALGTSLGSTAARLAIPNSLATSTPYNSGSNVVPVTGTNEKLSQLFLDLTQNFTWSGLHTFTAGLIGTASSTFSATTTIMANSVTNRALVLNTIPYQFPSSQGGTGQTFINNGSGVLSADFATAKHYTLASTTVSSIGSAGTILTSAALIVPANTLNASSTVRVDGHFHCADGGSGQTCELKIIDTNGNTYVDMTISPGVSRSCNMPFVAVIGGVNSISSQLTILNGGCNINTSFTDESIKSTSSANWALATGFQVQFISAAVVAASASLDGFLMTVTP